MSFRLADVVPWGRTLAEYSAMFGLSEQDLRGSILGCGDGPASFNAEASRRGCRVVSTDPIYRFSAAELESRIDETSAAISAQLKENADEFVWKHFPDPDALIEARMKAMRDFLADYPQGAADGRYIEAGLPELPFPDRHFDLALCSHFLFLYSEQRDLEFHIEALTELCRVAGEVRILPLLELGSVPSRHLEAASSALRSKGYFVETVRVDYEVQKGGNEMLRVVPD
jgi:hypothetical protein